MASDDEMDASYVFAAAAAAARLEALGGAAVDAAKRSVLDTIGVSLAASGLEPSIHPFLDVVREQGGSPQATVIGFGDRTSASLAAFLNGALAHCLDFDDQTPWGQHSGSSVVPSVLAIAERNGNVSGRDLITAVAVGQDMFTRLRLHTGWRKDWMLSSVGGVFAGAAACSRALGLDATRTQAALSIASQQSAGLHEIVAGTGSDLRGKYAGFSAKGAVLSALLAERGVTGVKALFEGHDGFFRLYFGGVYDREKLLANLGSEFLGSSTLYKRWPCVGTAHSHVHATIQLVSELDALPADIAEIGVYIGDYHRRMSFPLDVRRAPRTPVDAKFSLPFLVAVSAVRRGMTVRDLIDDAIIDEEVAQVAQLVVPIEDPSLDWGLELPAGRVVLTTRDGRRAERVGSAVPGSQENPMSWEELVEKFRDNAAAAAVPLSEKAVERVVELVTDLESLDDAAQVMLAIR